MANRQRIVLGGLVAVVGSVVLFVSISPGRPAPSARVVVARRTTPVTRHLGVRSSTATDPGLPPLAPTTASPLRVLEIGDSLGIDLGDQLESQLDRSGLARTIMASVGDSGLANVSFYNWPARLSALLASDHPQVVVVFMGANDDQGLYVGAAPAAPGSPAWTSAYAQRVGEVVREATTAGARVVWVGMPPMANPDLEAAMQRENAIYQRQTQGVAGALYVASAPVLPNAADLSLRTPDGVHLTPTGAALLARAVIDVVEARWHLSRAAPA